MSATDRSWEPIPDRLYALDAVESARLHPEWFFRRGEFDANELVSLLVEEAGRGGAQAVQIEHDDGWVGIAADKDWLEGDVAAFFAPVSYPAGGQNSIRAEVALTAYCDAVVTGERGEVFYEVKSSQDTGWAEHGYPMAESIARQVDGRVILFLLPEGDHVSPGRHRRLAEPAERGPYLLRGEIGITKAVESFVGKLQDA